MDDEIIHTASIQFRVFDRAVFEKFREYPGQSEAAMLVDAMLSGLPPVEAGYELVDYWMQGEDH